MNDTGKISEKEKGKAPSNRKVADLSKIAAQNAEQLYGTSHKQLKRGHQTEKRSRLG